VIVFVVAISGLKESSLVSYQSHNCFFLTDEDEDDENDNDEDEDDDNNADVDESDADDAPSQPKQQHLSTYFN